MANHVAMTEELMAMARSNNDTELLGVLTILSALLTEFRVAGLIDAEADKIDRVRAAVPGTQVATIGELIATNNSVAAVFEQLCCLENAIVNKINLGIFLLGGITPVSNDVPNN